MVTWDVELWEMLACWLASCTQVQQQPVLRLLGWRQMEGGSLFPPIMEFFEQGKGLLVLSL